MLTVEALKAFGANTEEGIARCVNNEQFYLRMVKKSVCDPNFDALDAAVRNNDLSSAFEAAHALKGIAGNLSLTPILDPVKEITELLRGRSETDYAPIVAKILEKKKELEIICED